MATTSTIRPLLPAASPESVGLDAERLNELDRLIERHIGEGRYPGAQIAVARDGKLVKSASFGRAKIEPQSAGADEATLWLMFSQTKVIVTAALWQLVEAGALRFSDKISDHIPEFAANGKGEITLFEVITHQGGFPSSEVPEDAWEDHDLLRSVASDFRLEWTPGSKVHYHGLAAHWVAAVLIEAVTGVDYREHIRRELLAPLGLDEQIFVGVSEEADGRCADIHEFRDDAMVRSSRNTRAWRAAGVPGGGGYGTATGLATFYQMLLSGGVLDGARVLGPRVIQFATRNHTGDRVDENMGMPMHRGLGPHVRGLTPTIRGLGTIASPTTFGHGGAGTSYSWGDPESGVSFSYLTNCMAPEPWHSARLDRVSNIVHSSIVEL